MPSPLETELSTDGTWGAIPSGVRTELERMSNAFAGSAEYVTRMAAMIRSLRRHGSFTNVVALAVAILGNSAVRNIASVRSMETIASGLVATGVGASVAQHLLGQLQLANELGPPLLRDLATLLGANPFNGMPEARQTTVIDVFLALWPESRAAFAALAPVRTVRYGHDTATGSPLLSTDLRRSGAQSLLDHVLAFIQGGTVNTGHDKGGLSDQQIKERFLADLLLELRSPTAEIDQGSYATCTATVMLHRLAIFAPAEYARLAIAALATVGAEVADGTLYACWDNRHADPIPLAGNGDARSISERLLQAMLIVAMDMRWSQDSVSGTNASSDTIARVLSQVFGRRYRAVLRAPMPRGTQDVTPVTAPLTDLNVRLHRGPVFLILIFGFTTTGNTNRHMVDLVWFSQQFNASFQGSMGATTVPGDPQGFYWFWNPWPRPHTADVQLEQGSTDTHTRDTSQASLPALQSVAHSRSYSGVSTDDFYRYWHTYFMPDGPAR